MIFQNRFLKPGELQSGIPSINYWAVENLDMVLERFIKLGAVIKEPEVERRFANAQLRDLWGNQFGLLHYPFK